MRDIRFHLKTHYSDSRALIIGINEYKNASPLSYAVSDAKEIRDVLVDELYFPEANITYLVDSEATKENILRALMSEFSFSSLDTVIRLLESVEKLVI